MHQPFDPANVTSDMGAPDYRVWLQYTPSGRRTVTATRVSLQPRSAAAGGGAIQPTRDRRAQLTARALPAHGIITEVRWRGWEWTFDRLPGGEFDVVVETTVGAQRYRVTSGSPATDARLRMTPPPCVYCITVVI